MCEKRKKNKKKIKTKKLSQFLKSHISGTLEAISLKVGMWSSEVGGSVHSKHRLVSSRQHRATDVQKLRFLSSCQYTHGHCAPASWAARHRFYDSRYQSVTSILQQLDWPTLHERRDQIKLIMMYKIIHGLMIPSTIYH